MALSALHVPPEIVNLIVRRVAEPCPAPTFYEYWPPDQGFGGRTAALARLCRANRTWRQAAATLLPNFVTFCDDDDNPWNDVFHKALLRRARLFNKSYLPTWGRRIDTMCLNFEETNDRALDTLYSKALKASPNLSTLYLASASKKEQYPKTLAAMCTHSHLRAIAMAEFHHGGDTDSSFPSVVLDFAPPQIESLTFNYMNLEDDVCDFLTYLPNLRLLRFAFTTVWTGHHHAPFERLERLEYLGLDEGFDRLMRLSLPALRSLVLTDWPRLSNDVALPPQLQHVEIRGKRVPISELYDA